MASIYQFFGESNAITYDAFGFCVLKRQIDIGNLVLNPGKLALAASPTLQLTTFPGLISGDVLQVFHVPAGFVGICGGSYIQAADGTQTTASFNLGDGGNAAGYQAAAAVDGASWQGTLNDDAYGGDNMIGYGYIVDDTIDITIATQTMVDAIFHVYVIGVKAFDITSVV
jgi:hypothetical protein